MFLLLRTMSSYFGEIYDEPTGAQQEVAAIEDILDAILGEAPQIDETQATPTTQSTESYLPTSPPATTTAESQDAARNAQPLDLMQIPDYLGGFLPTPTGYYYYLEKKMKETQQAMVDLKCPYCSRILGNKGSQTRHVKACKERPERVAERARQSTCGICEKVLKTRQAMLGHQRFCRQWAKTLVLCFIFMFYFLKWIFFQMLFILLLISGGS